MIQSITLLLEKGLHPPHFVKRVPLETAHLGLTSLFIWQGYQDRTASDLAEYDGGPRGRR